MPSSASGTALLIAARTCSSFGRTASGCAAMYSSTDLGTPFFIPVILCFGMWLFHTDIRLATELCCMERILGPTWARSLESYICCHWSVTAFWEVCCRRVGNPVSIPSAMESDREWEGRLC